MSRLLAVRATHGPAALRDRAAAWRAASRGRPRNAARRCGPHGAGIRALSISWAFFRLLLAVCRPTRASPATRAQEIRQLVQQHSAARAAESAALSAAEEAVRAPFAAPRARQRAPLPTRTRRALPTPATQPRPTSPRLAARALLLRFALL
jgi:hypothetical protein